MPPKKSKPIKGYLKVTPPAGNATPSPPLGPALGQRGLNIREFTTEFNKITQNMEKGMPVPTVITIYEDKSFSFIVKTPLTSYLLRKAAGIDKGAKEAGRQSVGKVTAKQVREIAELKMIDLNADDINAATKIIAGSARSMGIMIQG